MAGAGAAARGCGIMPAQGRGAGRALGRGVGCALGRGVGCALGRGAGRALGMQFSASEERVLVGRMVCARCVVCAQHGGGL